MSTTRAIFVSVFVIVSLSLAVPAQAFCGTEHPDHAVSDGVGKRASPCIGAFECNDPTIRDQYLRNSQSPMISVNLNVVYFGQLTGSAKTTYDAQMAFFQQEYAKHMNITWNINLRVVTDKYQSIDTTNGGPALRIAGEYYMPGYMTVLLSYFSPNPSSYLGFSFTPQSIDLVNHPEYLYAAVNLASAAFAPRATALLHEVGHMLGLLHSFSDSPCTQCSENINSPNGDVVGDYCSDTKPVWRTSSCTGLNIRNYDCNNVTYTTDLSQLPLDNYMAYTPPSCQTKFTPQQAARARCHLDKLISFVITKAPSAPVAIETPTGTPVASTPQSTTTPQSDTSPQSTNSPVIVPNSDNTTPNGSTGPVKQNTPSSSLTSFGSRTLVVTTLVVIQCMFVIL